MLNVVFWDRKNKREVRSSQLMFTNVVQHYVTCCDADDAPRPALEELSNTQQVIGEIGYKSESCPSYCNWDLYSMEVDLVFIRLEESNE